MGHTVTHESRCVPVLLPGNPKDGSNTRPTNLSHANMRAVPPCAIIPPTIDNLVPSSSLMAPLRKLLLPFVATLAVAAGSLTSPLQAAPASLPFDTVFK